MHKYKVYENFAGKKLLQLPGLCIPLEGAEQSLKKMRREITPSLAELIGCLPWSPTSPAKYLSYYKDDGLEDKKIEETVDDELEEDDNAGNFYQEVLESDPSLDQDEKIMTKESLAVKSLSALHKIYEEVT